MRIAVDAMGSDNCPQPDVTGAVMAAADMGHDIILVGDGQRVSDALGRHGANGLPIEVRHSSQAVTMMDRPAIARSKAKPDSSMHVGMRMVRDGQADAFVSMGNTGAALTIATLFTSVVSPASAGRPSAASSPSATKSSSSSTSAPTPTPAPNGSSSMRKWARSTPSRSSTSPPPASACSPTVRREGKGDELVRQTDPLLRCSGLNYIGNIEPEDVFRDRVDVVISDGFLGNMLVKTFESTSRYVTRLIHEEIRSDPLSLLAGALLQPAFRRVRRRADTFEVGGAPLLGVNGVVILGHGRSNAMAVCNAIRQAARAVESNVIETIRAGVRGLPAANSTQERGNHGSVA